MNEQEEGEKKGKNGAPIRESAQKRLPCRFYDVKRGKKDMPPGTDAEGEGGKKKTNRRRIPRKKEGRNSCRPAPSDRKGEEDSPPQERKEKEKHTLPSSIERRCEKTLLRSARGEEEKGGYDRV